MPQFSRQSSRPLTARSYRAAVARIRELAAAIEARAGATEPHDRAMLTRSIHGLAHAARDLSRRHSGVSVAQEMAGDGLILRTLNQGPA
jgi:hypothetical protein